MRHYIYDASGERTLKASSNYTQVYENGQPTNGGVTMISYTTYPSPYITISNAAVYTKHYFAGTQRVASRPIGSASIFNSSFSTQFDELKLKQMGDAQAVADSLELGQIEMDEEDLDPTPLPPAVYYFHPDHLGSSTVITDGVGFAYQIFLNLPFGANERKSHAVFLEVCERSSMAEQRRSGTFTNVFKFNGKELDTETGLYYYGARYYNPRISVWLSVDKPIYDGTYLNFEHHGGFLNSFNHGSYLYCRANPVLFIDPDGNQYLTRHIYYDENDNIIGRKTWDDKHYTQPGFDFKNERGVYYIHHYQGSRKNIVQKTQTSKIGNWGLYSGSGSITYDGSSDNYDFSMQPVDIADAVAKAHDMDYACAASADYKGFIEDTRTYEADKAMVFRAKYIIAGVDYRKLGLEGAYSNALTPEVKDYLAKQKTFINMLANYKKWRIDNPNIKGTIANQNVHLAYRKLRPLDADVLHAIQVSKEKENE
ncbi:RHS repeat-associated core domain-containing protein [Moheibacter sp.]|uniref:RHS repeat-associated core domain-containing protein n=1 Tax=Moheibacter sp. TaxID=1965316 RepID=UPI003C76E2A0